MTLKTSEVLPLVVIAGEGNEEDGEGHIKKTRAMLLVE